MPVVNTTALAVGLVFVLLGIFGFVEGATVSGVLAMGIGAAISIYAAFIPSDRQISRKVQRGMVEGFLELGEHRIRDGKVKVEFEAFKSVVEKLAPVIAELSTMPELGFDSIFLHYTHEHEAEMALREIRALSIEATIVQNKSNWSVRVLLS